MGWWFLADEENKMKKSKRSESAKKSSKKKNKKKPTQSKYKGYINGRDKRVRVPEENFKERLEELNDDDLQRLKDYLGIRKPSPDNLDYVYACPNCHVRITQRSDMLRVPHIWDEGNDLDMNAVFRWTTNLIERNGNVHCYRCNHDFEFKYRHDDNMILTLPMLKPGLQHRFLKREFRLLCLVYGKTFVTFARGMRNKPLADWNDRKKLKDTHSTKVGEAPQILSRVGAIAANVCVGKEAKCVKLYSTEEYNKDDYDFHKSKTKYNSLKYTFGGDTATYSQKLNLLSEAYSDLGFKMCTRRDLEQLEETQVTEDNTYDLALYFKIGKDDPGPDIFSGVETDHWAASTGTEKVHLLLWSLSGGNFLIGRFGTPGGAAAQCVDYSVWSQKLLGHDVDGDNERLLGSNGQVGFAKLIDDGHWLGRWGRKHTPSNEVISKIETALLGKQLCPTWLFLHDYPETVVNPQKRWDNGDEPRSKKEKYKPLFFYNKVTELYVPRVIIPEESLIIDSSERGSDRRLPTIKSRFGRLLEYLTA